MKDQKQQILFEVITPVVLAGMMASLVLSFGARRFGGIDLSHMINLGYRQYLGQIPFQDFYVTSPPLFFLGSKWALQLFGLKWVSYIKLAALFSFLSFLVHFYVLRSQKFIYSWSLLLASVTQVTAMVSVAYWWYNPVTAVLGVLFYSVTRLYLVKEKPNALDHLFLVLLTASLALSKPNVAGPLIFFSVLSVLTLIINKRFSTEKALTFFALGFCSAVLAAAFLYLQKVPLLDLWLGYQSASGRGVPTWLRFIQDMPTAIVYFWIALIALILSVLFAFRKSFQESDGSQRVWLVGGLLTAYIAFFTNGEPKLTDLSLLLVPIFLFGEGDLRSLRTRNIYAAVVVSTILFTGLYFGYERFRAKVIDDIAIGHRETELSHLNTFFEGTYGTPIHEHLLEEINALFGQFQGIWGRRPKVFFGFRLEFAYAAYQVIPQKGLPVFWWCCGVSFPESKIDDVIRSFKEAQYDLLVFKKHEYSYFPDPLYKYAKLDFRNDESYDTVSVYWRQ